MYNTTHTRLNQNHPDRLRAIEAASITGHQARCRRGRSTRRRLPPPGPLVLLRRRRCHEDELVAGIELGRHQQHRRPSAKQPGNSAPPIPNSPLPLARVLRVEGEFLDVETGQQQRHAFAVVVMPPPPLTQRRGSSSSAWRRAGLAAWRFCGVVARVVLRVVVLVLVAVLLLLLFSIVASLVQWCRGPGREICP
jgi:hypothetical protein